MIDIKNEDIRNILYEISKYIILPKFQKLNKEDVKLKNNIELVTSVDIDVEKKLKNQLLKLLPNSLFIGEESFFKNPKIFDFYKENKFCWTVDPIDGTANFVKGNEKFAIMIGLTFKEQIIQTWIYKPLSEELCYSKLNEGAYINDTKIVTLNDPCLGEAKGSISSKYWNEEFLTPIKKIKDNLKNTNSYGCIGFEYIDIAKNIRDFAILSKLSPWDHIPGILFLREAGGSVLHFNQSEYNHLVSKKNLVVTSSNILQNKIINLIGGFNEY